MRTKAHNQIEIDFSCKGETFRRFRKVLLKAIIMKTPLLLLSIWSSFFISENSAFSPPFVSVFGKKKDTEIHESKPLQLKDVVQKVAVTGATGRTGRLVVEELLEREVSSVVAIVRDTKKAAEIFPNPPDNLQIVQVDLFDENQIKVLCESLDAAIWCATGFSSNADTSPLERMKSLFGIATKRTIDTVGLPSFGKYLSAVQATGGEPLPKVILCSSAGVTRPIWDDAKKQRFPGAANIPIVRLNPFGILDIKRMSEEKLRDTGADYCIVRPSGLNDSWPAGSRPIFSQGDVAVGRINRKDVAKVLVDVLTAPEATGKTFETTAVAGYPKAPSIAPVLSRLRKDSEGLPSMEQIEGTYTAMQQLLPGEQQDAAALAMGQTYEQLDRGEEGRLGKRGQEKLSQIRD